MQSDRAGSSGSHVGCFPEEDQKVTKKSPKWGIWLTFWCLLVTLGALFLIFRGPGDRLEMWWFFRGSLGEPWLRLRTLGVVTGLSVGSSKQIKADKQSAKSWYQIGKLLIADWRTGIEWKWRETWLSTCDLNDWKDLGQADWNISFAAWWPLTSRGGRIYIYIYIYIYIGPILARYSNAPRD